jgi:DNA-binding NarL/FixJ family response regulator
MADVVRMAGRARALGGHVPKIRSLADVVEGEGLMPLGRTDEALALIRAGEPSLDLATDDLTLVAMVGASLLWTEQRADARTFLEDLILAGRTGGAISRLVFPLAARADLERRLGRWHAALADAREAVRLGRDAGLFAHMSFGLAISARVDGPMGRFDAARRDAGEARALTTPTGGGSLLLHALGALGITELSARRPAAAAEALREALRRYRDLGWHEPSVAAFHGDLIEALVELGERDEAAEVLAALDADIEVTATRWPRAIAARARGLLAGDADEAVAHFAGALELHAAVDEPFERARTELLLADRLREAGRRDEAREPVRRAIATLDQLGAAPWAQRAREVLAVTRGPGRLETVAPSSAPDLTPQEWRVALLVAQGMTNREAGAAVFLSARTIEHILTAIYKKVGVRSRTELARRIAAEDVPAGVGAE